MKKVRYFGKLVDPANYRHGYGIRGWWINFINRIRVFLERHIVLQILGMDADRQGWDKEEVVQEAKRNPDVQPWLGIEERFKKAPKTLERTPTRGFSSHEEKVESRYGYGRKNHPDHRPQRVEDSPLVTTFSVAARHQDRSARYATGRQPLVYDGYFEPVDEKTD